MCKTRKSSLFGKITVLVVICFFCLSAHAKYGGGNGTAEEPYLIYDANQMNAIGADSNDWDKCFKLMADIDLSDFTGTSFNIIGSSRSKAFTGVFYGDNHTISNFTYHSIDAGHLGIFGFVGSFQIDGEINNLGLIGPDVNTVTGHYVGSLVGHLIDGKITNCYVEGGSVAGDAEVGGLVGDNYKGRITNCYSTCSITGNKYVGGLVGHSYEGTITNCYSTGSVAGDTRAGGLMGFSHEGRITNCYSTGSVTGTTYVGGLLGKSSGHVVTSYWDIETSGQITSDGGTGLPTAQMQMARTFVMWACDYVWTIDEGKDYPRFCRENMPGVSITPQLFLGGGIGEPNDPYLIYTAEQLNAIGLLSCEWNKHFKLMADIDLSAFTGTSFNIIGYRVSSSDNKSFTGVFDGNGHTISNFTYTSTDTDYIGLFGYVGDSNAVIKDLGLIAPNVDAGTGRRVGSLLGRLKNGAITGCFVDSGSVVGNSNIGGLVGFNRDGTITDSYSSCSVSGNYDVGGLVGANSGGTISKCYSTGSVSGTGWYVGGLVGQNSFKITNSYSTGTVLGDDNVGGLVGVNSGTITNCYSAGSVSGIEYVGGLLGKNSGEVIGSFWDIETSGQAISAGGKGKTTAQMMMEDTFVHWGTCGQVWTINEGVDYPRLVWENKPGEPIVGIIPFEGDGAADSPYLIHTPEELNLIGLLPCMWDKHFKLMADIDLGQYTGTEFNIIGTDSYHPFTGVFDGSGHTISNFSYTSVNTDNRGLFGYVDDPNAEIKDLGLIDSNVDAGTGDYVGSLVGYMREGTITNCYVQSGSVSGDYHVGGLVGFNWDCTISNCYATGTVSGFSSALYGGIGGLVGRNDGTITNSYSSGNISGRDRVGGLVGDNYKGTITNCYSTGSVTGTSDVGGMVGFNRGTISNCYSTGSISGGDYVGGLVGKNGRCMFYCSPGTISNCYSTGSVSDSNVLYSNVGGLVGHNEFGTISTSFWDIETSGQTTSDGGTGLTTAEMQMMSTFTDAGWDFVGEIANGTEDIWWIIKGDYPHLWWEGVQVPMKLTPGTLNCRSKGGWVKAHLVMPAYLTVEDVDSNILGRIDSLGIEADFMDVFVDEDGLVRVEMAFDRAALCEKLTGDGFVEITVRGFLTNGQYFYGTETIKIK